jgi:hypothetical protein
VAYKGCSRETILSHHSTTKQKLKITLVTPPASMMKNSLLGSEFFSVLMLSFEKNAA